MTVVTIFTRLKFWAKVHFFSFQKKITTELWFHIALIIFQNPVVLCNYIWGDLYVKNYIWYC